MLLAHPLVAQELALVRDVVPDGGPVVGVVPEGLGHIGAGQDGLFFPGKGITVIARNIIQAPLIAVPTIISRIIPTCSTVIGYIRQRGRIAVGIIGRSRLKIVPDLLGEGCRWQSIVFVIGAGKRRAVHPGVIVRIPNRITAVDTDPVYAAIPSRGPPGVGDVVDVFELGICIDRQQMGVGTEIIRNPGLRPTVSIAGPITGGGVIRTVTPLDVAAAGGVVTDADRVGVDLGQAGDAGRVGPVAGGHRHVQAGAVGAAD